MTSSSTQPDVIMTCAVTFVLILSISLPIALCQNEGQYKPPNNSPYDDPGHNSHQETVIFVTVGASAVMIVLVIVLLWFLVNRTQHTVSIIERMLPDIVEKMKSGEIEGKGLAHLSGTFDAKGEFEAGFKGSADFLDATGDRVKLTSYSKRDDTITTVVAGTRSSGLTSYTRKVNGNLPIDNTTEAGIINAYAEMEEHVLPHDVIDGPMNKHARVTSSRDRGRPSEVSISPRRSRQERMSSGSYQDPFSPNDINSTNHTNLRMPNGSYQDPFSPNDINSTNHTNLFGYEGFHQHNHRHTPPVIPKDPEKAALFHNGGGLLYSDPPAYEAAYENKALSIDKRATLPITDAPSPGSKEKLVNDREDKKSKKKRNRSSSYYVESHV